MLNFLIKDWYLNRLMVFLFVGVIVFNTAVETRGPVLPKAIIGFHCVVAAMLPISFLAREGKFRSRALICSLPLTRRTINRYRYLSAWAYAAGAGLFAALLLGADLAAKSELSRLFTPGVLLVGLTCLSVALAVLLPVVIRFGLLGMLIPLVIAQVLGVVVMIVVSVRSRQFSVSNLILPVRAGLDTAYSQLGPPLYYLAWLALLIMLNLLSYKLSEWLFARQDC